MIDAETRASATSEHEVQHAPLNIVERHRKRFSVVGVAPGGVCAAMEAAEILGVQVRAVVADTGDELECEMWCGRPRKRGVHDEGRRVPTSVMEGGRRQLDNEESWFTGGC